MIKEGSKEKQIKQKKQKEQPFEDLEDMKSLETLKHLKVVSDYIFELTASGPFLPYEDHDLIKAWLQKSHLNQVLLALDEVYENHHRIHNSYPKNIRMIHGEVMRVLRG